MKIFKQIPDWQEQRKSDLKQHFSLGFVPTMGALHAGHASLIRQSIQQNDRTLVSIFVNPTQFDQAQDLEKYPQTFAADCDLLKNLGVDYLFTPSYHSLYPDDYRYRVSESQLSHLFCGAHRPGHFDGVLTVVLKLLILAEAHTAYFGEKDFQQYRLVKDMAEAFFLSVKIQSCTTVREVDGLAMSSRNVRLTEKERALAPSFYSTLRDAPSTQEAHQLLTSKGFQVEYVEEYEGRRLGAVKLNDVRLIDNVSHL